MLQLVYWKYLYTVYSDQKQNKKKTNQQKTSAIKILLGRQFGTHPLLAQNAPGQSY